MSNIKLVLFSIIFAQVFNAQKLQNPDFENSIGNQAQNWLIKKTENYDFAVDSQQKHSGEKAFLITGKSLTGSKSQFFSQTIIPEQKGLQKIEISAYIKSSEVSTGRINLWAKVLDAKREKIDFINSDLQKQKIEINQDWAKYSVELILDENAKEIIVGGIFTGLGNVWFDDFEIKNIKFSEQEASKDALDYIEYFKNVVKTKSIFNDRINWSLLENNLTILSKGSKTIEDTNPALQYIMKALKNVGDNHSFILSKNDVDAKKNGNTSKTEAEYKLINNEIGYIKVPGFSTSNTEVGNDFAIKINTMIKKLDTENTITSWIIDLRNNPGGTIHPMILGLSSFLGNETLGYFVTKDKKTPWIIENGKFGKYKLSEPYSLKKANPKIAVLIGSQTKSAGEVTAIAFIGKNNAKLFGQPSGGYTTANTTFPLSDGRALALATAFEMDRNGKEYLGKIKPDVAIESKTNNDDTLEAAKKWILD